MPKTKLLTAKEKEQLKNRWDWTYHKPIFDVESWFMERGLDLQWDVNIYPLYPWGFEAVTGCIDLIWVLQSTVQTGLVIVDIQETQGFYEDGRLVYRRPEKGVLYG